MLDQSQSNRVARKRSTALIRAIAALKAKRRERSNPNAQNEL